MNNLLDRVIWVDENDNVLGEVTRGEAHIKGLPHRIAVVYLTNDKGQILVQERADGHLDHSSAGHVDVGEEYIDAARRELKEELGIEGVEFKEIGHANSVDENYQGEVRNHTFKIFTTKAEPGVLNKEEVKSVFWTDPKEIYKDMEGENSGKYTGGFKVSLKCFLDNYEL